MRWTFDLQSYLEGRSQRSLLLITALLVLLIWMADYASGPQLSVSIFYLLPVGLATWYVNRWAGILVALASATAWLVTDLTTNPYYENPLIPFWNAGVRLGIFVIVTYVLASLKLAQERQEELMAFVVHDLGAPLSNILGSLQMVGEFAADGEVGTVQELIEICLSSGKQMLILIDSLLDLARLRSGKMPVQPQIVAVDALFKESSQQVSGLGQMKEVDIELIGADGGCAVRADRVLLVRVLVNLLSNAIRFSPSHTTVVVEARPAKDGLLLISVSDQGPGIPEKWRRQAFHKFEQVQARKAGAAVGSGLGLTFCRMAVEAQGGHIWLDSGRERGTVVQLTLPMGNKT
ncbi:MAG: HAMP domain-containing sensor histidine kinase [Chloroflexota bacterium]